MLFRSWATRRTIKINALIGTSLFVTNVSFGNLTIHDIENTTDDSPNPFILQNDGNCLLNISIDATSLFESAAHPSSYYQFKVDNYTLENGSFMWDYSLYSWTDIPSATTHAITELNNTDDTDTVEVDIKLTVPPEEPGGYRDSTVTFTESLAE